MLKKNIVYRETCMNSTTYIYHSFQCVAEGILKHCCNRSRKQGKSSKLVFDVSTLNILKPILGNQKRELKFLSC